MKDYSNFNAVELAQDEDFIRWVESNHKDKILENQWNAWLSQYPDRVDVINEAIRIVKAVINERQYFLHDSKQQELWSRIENSVTLKEKAVGFSKSSWYAIAASIAFIIITVATLFQSDSVNFTRNAVAEYHAADKKQLLRYSNEGNKPHSLVLEDGSVVTLQPHSSIDYPETFLDAKRDVYLSGEAFFEVTRNPQKPFSVYANEIVTRVLGTSFTVRAYKKERNVVVAVKTGKVSVFTEAEGRIKKDSTQNLIGTLLTPNQQITFSRDETRMVKSLVDEPIPLPSMIVEENFQFTDTPISEVFERLERAYGFDIIFDEEAMKNCLLNTTSLKGIPFYDKLRLICKGVNAKYEILDAHVIISGNGCK